MRRNLQTKTAQNICINNTMYTNGVNSLLILMVNIQLYLVIHKQ